MIQKVRQSNIELLRLICMFMILVGHASGYLNEKDLVGGHGVFRLLVNQFCLVGVDVFVLISGWFGIKASFRGAGKLLFQVLFITILCVVVSLLAGLPISFREDVLPFLLLGQGYWFVVSYLILYAISPVLNAFVEKATQGTFRTVLLSWFGLAFFYGFLLDAGHFDYGFSALSFIGLYLLARYVRLYPGRLTSFSAWTDAGIYAGATLLSALLFWYGYKWFSMGFHLNHNDSPLAILAALYLLLAFSKINLQSRMVNWLAASAFAIYLIHENALVSPYYHQLFQNLDQWLPAPAVVPVAIVLFLLIGLACILVDKIRILAWNALPFYDERKRH